MAKTINLRPTKAPFTNTITFQRAVEFNLHERNRTTVEPAEALATMLSRLLEELYSMEALTESNIARILDLEITRISQEPEGGTNKIN